MKYLVKGIFVDTPTKDNLRIREGYLLIEDEKIVSFYEDYRNNENLPVYDYTNKLIIPGISDLHFHAPQYNYIGTAMDLELMEWLDTYTFPEESKFKDIEYAKKTYELLVDYLVHSATTRACIFSSIHTDATLELMDQLEKNKICAYVGKVAMDRNSPSYYIEKDGVKETIRYLDECEKRNYKFVKPIITPRFTPSCTDEYMEALGKLAVQYGVPAQSHLSENNAEIAFVKELCPNDKVYAESYAKYGLFGNPVKTVMAHCIHSTDFENQMIKSNGVYIAHCPTSNVNVIAGICPSAMYLRNGYNIGLGSDIAGGNTLNMFEVMKTAIQSSKNRYKLISNEYKPLSFTEVFYMATVGGGSFFGDVGLFEKGYEFDALVLEDEELKSMREQSIPERLERFVYLIGGKITDKFVKGNKLF